MVANSDLIKAANDVAEDIREKSSLWRMKFARPLFGRARLYLTSLGHRLHEVETEVIRLRREVKLFPAQLRREREEAEKVSNRIILALHELEKYKGNFKSEKPFAILLSPYQVAQVRSGRTFFDSRWHIKDAQTTFFGLPVYVAKHIYGPLAVTEAGFNALSRNAPELLIKGA
jgi:hypothetical protein